MRPLIILGTILAVATAAFPALAGCPSAGSGCDMATRIGVKLEPRVSCIEIGIDSNDCTCTAAVTVYNDCAAEVMASDFEFTRCEDLSYWDSMLFDCMVLPPGWRGDIDLPLQPDAPHGYYEDTLHLTIDGEQHALDLRYEVSKYSLGGFCGCGAAGEDGIPAGALLLLALVSAVALARQRSA